MRLTGPSFARTPEVTGCGSSADRSGTKTSHLVGCASDPETRPAHGQLNHAVVVIDPADTMLDYRAERRR
jgi:hypothetical protein